MKHIKNKRGITIAECVIAMAVILVVSIAATSTIRLSTRNTAQDLKTTEARVAVSNALEIFKISITPTDFKNRFEFYFSESDFAFQDNSTAKTDVVYNYTKTDGNITTEITYTYTYKCDTTANISYFTGTVKVGDRVISEVKYEKPCS